MSKIEGYAAAGSAPAAGNVQSNAHVLGPSSRGQALGQAEAAINIAQASEKIKCGDLKGAAKELEQACAALKDAGKGAEKGQPPGQQLGGLEDLLKQLREILDQGKGQSPSLGDQVQGAQGGQGAQGAQQGGGMQQILEMIMQLIKQLAGGGPETKTA